MDSIDILNLRQRVSDYIRGFHSPDPEFHKNILLKEVHTKNVADNMIRIAESELKNRNKVFIAEAIGLLHDIGRFPQYSRYGTFRDSISANHGRLGAEVIEQEKVLAKIPLNEQDLISEAVRFHNAFAVPKVLDPEIVYFLRMVRDADKLDIWRVFTEQFSLDEKGRASAAGLGLPDTPEYSDAILNCLRERRQASLAGLRTLTDFKILQLTWIYDLNFSVSFRILSGRDHIDRIIAMLPDDKRISEAVAVLKSHIRQKCSG